MYKEKRENYKEGEEGGQRRKDKGVKRRKKRYKEQKFDPYGPIREVDLCLGHPRAFPGGFKPLPVRLADPKGPRRTRAVRVHIFEVRYRLTQCGQLAILE